MYSQKSFLRVKNSRRIFVLSLIFVTTFLWSQVTEAKTTTLTGQLEQIWSDARDIGIYDYQTEVIQTIYPTAQVSNIGRSPSTRHMSVTGSLNQHEEEMLLQIRGLTNGQENLDMKVVDGVAYGRLSENAEWEEIDNQTTLFAPNGDPLGFLASVENVTLLTDVPEGDLLTEMGITSLEGVTRYGFEVNGRSYAQQMRLEAQKVAYQNGDLLPNMEFELAEEYVNMTANGELWVGTNGLPVRQIIVLEFPASEGAASKITAQMTTHFNNWDITQAKRKAPIPFVLSVVQDLPTPYETIPHMLMPIFGLGLCLLLVKRRQGQSRYTYPFISAFVILSMLFATHLEANRTYALTNRITTQREEQAQQDQQQEALVNLQQEAQGQTFDPQRKPTLANKGITDWLPENTSRTTLLNLSQTIPVTSTATTGVDTDGDGLNDEIELLQLGTNYQQIDTDGDGISDKREVEGFSATVATSADGSVMHWYLDPLNPDSNGDGLSDTIECTQLNDISNGAIITPTSVSCEDTDNDAIPDVFDFDNDGDGVPDSVDISPNGATGLLDDLDLNLAGYNADKLLTVNFELRPEEYKQLFQTNNVLDWPDADTDGQIVRNEYGSNWPATWTDYDPVAYSNDAKYAYGDVMLTPMLEIAIPRDNNNPTGGLPVLDTVSVAGITPQTPISNWLDTDTLDMYGISITEDADTDTLYAYISLSLVEDNVGETPVAWGGQMVYRPEADWATAHNVKMAWMVTVLNDACDASNMPNSFSHPNEDKTVSATDDNALDLWCQYESYEVDGQTVQIWSTEPTIAHVYYEPFQLTGLEVKEEHGMEGVIISQNDALATSYESSLWHLADGLQSTYLTSQLVGADRFSINDIVSRFGTGSTATTTEQWGLNANNLTVEQVSAGTQATGLEAYSTQTDLHLANRYGSATDGSMVNLLFVYEETYRSLQADNMVFGQQMTMDLSGSRQETYGTVSLKPYEYNTTSGWGNADAYTYFLSLQTDLAGMLSDTEIALFLDSLGNGVEYNEELVRQGIVSIGSNYYNTLYDGMVTLIDYEGEVVNDEVVSDSDLGFGDFVGEGEETAVLLNISQSVTLLMQNIYQTSSSLILDNEEISNNTLTFLTIPATILEVLGTIQLGYTSETANTAISGAKTVRASLIGGIKSLGKQKFVISKIGTVFASVNTDPFKKIDKKMNHTLTVVKLGLRAIGYIEGVGQNQIYQITSASFDVAATMYSSYKTYDGLKNVGYKIGKGAKITAVIGLVIEVSIIWGAFIHNVVVTDSLSGIELSLYIAQTIAATIIAILYFVLTLTVVGAFIVALISIIDTIIALVCKIVGDVDSTVDRWVCGGITGALTQGIMEVIFQYTTVVDFDDEDRLNMALDRPVLSNEKAGFIVGNSVTLAATITNTLSLNDNTDEFDPTYTALILHLMGDSLLKQSAFDYRLQKGESDHHSSLAQDTISWNSSNRAVFNTNSITYSFNEPSLAYQLEDLTFTESFNTPAIECWGFLALSVCQEVSFKDSFHTSIDGFIFDVLPADFSTFMAMTLQENGSYALAWDEQFPTLYDADGDGLVSKAKGGVDPDDSTPDTDGDGLTDYWEYVHGTDPQDNDTDNDGLYDYWEQFYGTDGGKVDTDLDGLSDADEFFHPDANYPYDQGLINNGDNSWSGGWRITYDYGGANNPLKTLVSADPTTSDPDFDGISDKKEFIYAYNPYVSETLNILSLESGVQTTSQIPGYYALTGTVDYTATIVNELDVYAYGLLQAELPLDTVQSNVSFGKLEPNGYVNNSFDFSGSVPVQSAGIQSSSVLTFAVRAGAILGEQAEGYHLNLDFDETSGNNFVDSSGNGFHAVCSTACPTAHADGYLDFDGANDVVYLNEESRFDFVNSAGNTDSFAIALWFKVDTFDEAWQTLVAKGTDSWRIYRDGTNNTLSFVVDGLGTVTGGTAVNDGQWHQVVAVYSVGENESNLELYLDGQPETSLTITGQPAINTNDSLVTIGATDTVGGRAFDGQINDLTIYNHALTRTEIENIFTLTPIFTTSDSAVQEQFFKSTTYECTTDCPTTVDGVMGEADSFDETSLYAVNNMPRISENDNSFTLGTWIYPESTYTPNDILFREHGVMIFGNDDNGYETAVPSFYVKDNEIIVRFGYTTNYCQAETSGDVLQLNSWQHIVVTYDGAGTFELFVDGQEVQENWQYQGDCQLNASDQIVDDATYYIGHGRSPAIYYKELDSVRPQDGTGEDKEGYIWVENNVFDNGYIGTNSNVNHIEAIWYSEQNQIDAFAGPFSIQKLAVVPGETISTIYCITPGLRATNGCQPSHMPLPILDGIGTFTYGEQPTGSYYGYYYSSWIIGSNLTFDYYEDGFRGQLDELNFYRTNLNAEQAKQLFGNSYDMTELKFDEAPGLTSFRDSSNNGFNAHCLSADNCPDSGVPGRNNQALYFDGNDDYLTLPSPINPAVDTFSAGLWFKTEKTGVHQILMGQAGTEAWLGINQSNNLYTHINGGSSPYLFSDQVVTDGEWHHAAISYDGTTVTLYLDGQIATVNGVAQSADIALINNNSDLRVGIDNDSLDNEFEGYMDDLVILDYAVTMNSLDDLMGRAPVLNLKLDDELNTALFQDASQLKNHATCANDCPHGGDKGEVREAVVFDGVADGLTVPHHAAYDFSNYTLAMWVKPDTLQTQSQALVNQDNGSTERAFSLTLEADGKLHHDMYTNGQCTNLLAIGALESVQSLVAGQWQHVAITYDGFYARLYINGTLDSTSSYIKSVCSADTPIHIGWHVDGSHLDGVLDEMALYTSAMDDDDIKGLYEYQVNWYDLAQQHEIVIDAEAPTVALNLSTSYVVGGQMLSIQADDVTSRVEQVWYRVDNGSWTKAVADGTMWLFAFPKTAVGSYNIYLRAQDSVGNTTETSTPVIITIEETAPTITLNSAIQNGDGSVTLTGSVSDSQSGLNNQTLSLSVVNNEGIQVSDVAKTELSGTTASWVITQTFAQPLYGMYTIEANTQDTVGNKTGNQSIGSVALDHYPPVADVTLAGDIITRSTTLLTGTITDTRSTNPITNYEDTLELWLELDDADGVTTFADSSGNGYVASCRFSAYFCPMESTDGYVGIARPFGEFDGNQLREYHVSIPHTDTLDYDVNESFTVATWFKRGSIPSFFSREPSIFLLGKTEYWAQPAPGWSLRLDNDRVAMYLTDGDYRVEEKLLGETIQSEQWYHLAGVVDREKNEVRLYLDGVLVDKKENFTATVANTHDFSVGCTFNAGYDECMIGFLDDVRLYHSALTDADIADLVANSNLIAHLEMDDTPYTTTFADASFLGHDATCNGNTCPTAGVGGQIGSAAYFDGNDYAQITFNSGFDFSNAQFTQMAWIYPSPDDTAYHAIMGYPNQSPIYRAPSLYILGERVHGGFGDGSSWNNFLTEPVLTLNTWNHIAATFDGTTYRLYIDGVQTYSTTSWAGKIPYVTTQYNIGWIDNYFEGRIDDVRIYKQATSEEQINAFMLDSLPMGTDMGVNRLDVRYRHASGAVWPGLNVDDLRLYLPFDNGYDENLSRLNYTIQCDTDCPLTEQGAPHAHGLTFDGFDDAVTVSDELPIDFGVDDDFTVAVWVKADPNQAINLRPDNDIVEKWDGNGGYPFVIRYVRGTGTVQAARYDGTNNPSIESSIVVNDGNFHHVAFVKRGEMLHLYVDGVPQGTAVDTTTGNTQNSSPLYLGRRGNNTSQYFTGSIDELVIFGRGLLQDEVQQLLTSPWTSTTLETPTQYQSDWQVVIPQTLEGPYKIDLWAVDDRGNAGYVPDAWSGEIDTRAPQLTLNYALVDTQSAEISCVATDYNLTQTGWNCPSTTTTLAYQDANWFSSLFTSTNKLEAITTVTQTVPLTMTTMTACDSWGACTTQSIADVMFVDIVSPEMGTVFNNLGSNTISGSAYASNGIQSLVVSVNGQALQTISYNNETSITWSVPWEMTANGSYVLTAVLTDSQNNTKTDSVTITVELLNCFTEYTGDNITDFSSADGSAIQQAINAVGSGGTVKVAGTCAGGLSTISGYTQIAYLNKALTLQGGYEASNWLATPDPETYPTVLDAQGSGRVIYVLNGSGLTIAGLTLTGGDSATAGDIRGRSGGGGIGIDNSRDMVITDTLIYGNQGHYGGGIHKYGGGNTYIYNSVIISNTATNVGGGIQNIYNTLTIENSTISHNSAVNSGGGVWLSRHGLVLKNSTISHNSGGNTGGGILTEYANINLTNSTIVYNTASSGAGIYGRSGHYANATQSVIANNIGNADCANYTFNSNGYNLLQTTGNCSVAGDITSTITGVDPLLGALDNQTWTHVPANSSKLVDAIPADECATTVDQAGAMRPQGVGCDIGAVEIADVRVLHLQFEETAGTTTFADASTNQYQATCNGTSCPVAGNTGFTDSGLAFDGTNDQLVIAHNNQLDVTEQESFTVASWVKIDSFNDYGNIIGKKSTGGTAVGWLLRVNNNNSASLFVADGTNAWWTTGPANLQTNRWYHLAGVIDRDLNEVRLYVNGVLVAKSTNVTGSFSNDDNILLGSWPGGGDYLDGMIDETMVYGHALTPDEIDNLVINSLGMGQNVPEASDYTLLYALDIPNNADYNGSLPAYEVDNTNDIGSYDRVAYYMRLDDQWAYASMDAFTTDPTQLGIPTFATGATFDQTVQNLNVASNVVSVTTGNDITTGNIEFWHQCYGGNADSGLGGNSGTYDFDDAPNTTNNCYGSFQIHNYGAGETIMAWNRWESGNGSDDVGLGNQNSTQTDWTFAQNAGNYSTRKLYVLVRELETDPNLLLQLNLDETVGATTFTDTSGNHNDATCSGSACPTAGEAGYRNTALSFDGVDDDIQVASGIDISHSSFTISAWAKRDAMGSSNQFILTQGTNSGHVGLHFGFRSNGLFTCAFYGNDINSLATYTDTDWHHWACTYDASTNTRILYRDGVEINRDTASADYQGTGTIYVGTWVNGSHRFNGSIDEVQVFNRDLSMVEVNNLMLSSQPNG